MANNFLFRQIFKSIFLGANRVFTIVLSIFLAALVSSAFLNIYFDLGAKLSHQLKAYGANVNIIAARGGALSNSNLAALRAGMGAQARSLTPYFYSFVAVDGVQTLSLGTDFAALRVTRPFLEVREGGFGARDFAADSAFLGIEVAKKIIAGNKQETLAGLIGQEIEVYGGGGAGFDGGADLDGESGADAGAGANSNFDDEAENSNSNLNERADGAGANSNLNARANSNLNAAAAPASRSARLKIRGIIQSGDELDGVIIIPLATAQRLAATDAVHYATALLYGTFDEVGATAARLSTPATLVKPISSVSMSEELVLGKLKALMFLIVLVVLIITSTSVNTTLSSIIFARKKEVALHLALGAKRRDIARLFGAEVAILAVASAVVGAVAGIALANLFGYIIFGSGISPRAVAIACAVGVSLVFAAAAAFLPIKKALDVNVCEVLKGE